MHEQSETLKKQQFENGFFSLLNMFYALSREKERKNLNLVYQTIYNAHNNNSSVDDIKTHFLGNQHISSEDYAHTFFISFYSVLDFIELSNISFEEKRLSFRLAANKIFKDELYY